MRTALNAALLLLAGMIKVDLAQEMMALSIRQAFVQVMRGANLPGGIELTHCGSSEPLVTIEQGTSVKTALERIKAVRPDLSLDTSNTEVVNILNDSPLSDLLKTRIANLNVPNPRNGAAAIRAILNTPEARTRISALHLEEAQTQLGFSAIAKPGTVQAPVAPLKLDDVTMRQALNAIAAASKRGVWIYEEWGCSANGERSFALSFAVQ